ncbi:hypothetical protein GGF46_002937 [Coemansia sp. RSA 552]|nr:hypothetical protein GGF46_002937 [Coemansia sp. RSA 552]
MWDDSPSFHARSYRHAGNNLGEYDSFDEGGEQLLNDGPLAPHTPSQTYGGIRQVEQTSLSVSKERTAAANLNPYAALHQINRELMELGLPSPLMLPELPEYIEDNQRVVDCLVALLQQRQRDLKFRDTMDDELRKAMGEEDVLRSTIGRLERELDQAQREAAMNRVKWDEAERQCAEGEAQRRRMAAELRTTRSNAAMVKAQFMHDGKKREQEAIRLKDRLQKLITDKHRSAKLGVELVNPIARDRSGRPMEATLGRDRQLLEELIGRYEANEAELVAKIDRLEELVRRMAAALRRLHGEVVAADAASPGEIKSDADGLPDVDQALELLDSIRDCVHAERSQKAGAIDQMELDQRDGQIGKLQAEIDQQQEEIAELKRVLDEQKQVIDMMANKERVARLDEDALDASFSEMSLEQLDAEREAVRHERQQLEDERQRFTEAAIELGNERSDLKREREEFERSRTSQGTADLVSALPPTPQWMRGIDTSQQTPMILSQLQGMYSGTPTNDFLASMAAVGAAYSAGMASAANGPQATTKLQEPEEPGEARAPEDEFPQLTSGGSESVDRSRAPTQTPQGRLAGSMASKRTVVRPPGGSDGSRAWGGEPRTPARPTPTRTPAEIRSGRQARVCTRPGCAAHAPHTHEDGSAAPVMELKPPVPRFRRKADGEDSNGSGSAKPRRRAADIYK